jgi:hypothetical protein
MKRPYLSRITILVLILYFLLTFTLMLYILLGGILQLIPYSSPLVLFTFIPLFLTFTCGTLIFAYIDRKRQQK